MLDTIPTLRFEAAGQARCDRDGFMVREGVFSRTATAISLAA